MSFQEFGLSDSIVRAVVAEGYEIPTPIQAQAIPHVLAGRDFLGCAQTGTGKTAAFALPILHRLSNPENGRRGNNRRVRVLVLAPTRELATQIVQSFRIYGRQTGLRQTSIIGGVGKDIQIRALRQGVDILVATPGRLVDLLNQGIVNLTAIETLVIDEADRMFDMGFLPDLRRIILKLPVKRQTVFFSATMPPAIEQLANAVLREPVRIKIEAVKETTDLIDQSVCFVSHSHKVDLLAKILAADSVTRAIVFTRTKHGADRVVRRLDEFGIESVAIHGNKSQAARDRALAGFKTNRAGVGRDRSGLAGDRRQRRVARLQLRPSRGAGILSPPDRPHRPRRRFGSRHRVLRRRRTKIAQRDRAIHAPRDRREPRIFDETSFGPQRPAVATIRTASTRRQRLLARRAIQSRGTTDLAISQEAKIVLIRALSESASMIGGRPVFGRLGNRFSIRGFERLGLRSAETPA